MTLALARFQKKKKKTVWKQGTVVLTQKRCPRMCQRKQWWREQTNPSLTIHGYYIPEIIVFINKMILPHHNNMKKQTNFYFILAGLLKKKKGNKGILDEQMSHSLHLEGSINIHCTNKYLTNCSLSKPCWKTISITLRWWKCHLTCPP